MRILLVEDEIRLTDALSCLLAKEKIKVDVANDGETGLLYADKQIFDVLVLDIMLPEKSGLEILKEIRNKGDETPVILLTARDTIEDKVAGLDLGADDYLVKPFATQELLARIRSLARRTGGSYNIGKLVVGNVEYDSRNFMMQIEDKKYSLSAKEGQLLEMFMKRPQQIFTREQIIDRIWGNDADILNSNVEIYIHHLRKKMKKGATVEIKTIRNVGYMLKEREDV